MLKGRGRDPRGATSPLPGHHTTTRPPGVLTTPPPGHPNARAGGVTSPTPVHLNTRLAVTSPTPGHRTIRSPGPIHRAGLQQRPLPSKPEPDYEVVEFPSDQYVNAKLQPPPPPPPRPPTGHPAQAGASCGLCGGGGARVRCAECGRRALCASCDDMYHRHPKRRHHQRQALSLSQLGEDRPPLPPKGTPPVPPPRRNKMNASPMPPMTPIMQDRRATLAHGQSMTGMRASASPTLNQTHQLNQSHQMNQNHNLNQVQPVLVQAKMVNSGQMASMPFLPTTMPHQHPMHQQSANTIGHLNAGWNRPRGSLQGFNAPQVPEAWDSAEGMPPGQGWARPMRRGASVLELGGGGGCAGCAHCAPAPWRYGSCAALDQPWGGAWPAQQCCPPHQHLHMQHVPHTPQPYRRADSRAMSRAASRTGSRAASPALSVRSRASRRTKHRSPSPPLPSSDADSESESESEPAPKSRDHHSRPERPHSRSEHPSSRSERPNSHSERPNSHSERPNSHPERPASRSEVAEDGLGPVPPPPDAAWQCEHCTYVNEPGVRVCVICCRTPTAAPKVVAEVTANFERMKIASRQASPVLEKVETTKIVQERSPKSKKERASTGCGPSPPREDVSMKSAQRLITPTRDQPLNGTNERQNRHDMAVGPSPPRDVRSTLNMTEARDRQPIRAYNTDIETQRHSVSVGPSPPRESSNTGQKKSAGTSPPRDVRPESRSSIGKTNVSNTGTSPPPQSISTQTYEDPSTYERAGSVARSRPRRRFRDERRERSRSRHSLSSDTRESDRSVRTTGAWEWRERDSSPSAGGGGGGEWGGRLARRASHLDLRRRDVTARRTSLYHSQAPSPEPPTSGRAISMEVLSGRNAERGLELARLLAEAERLGFSAAEVQVGLSQSAGAPLAWLASRWAGLVGAVVGAAARLAPHAPLSETAARAALARHRGAVWPAVTECVDTLRRQTEPVRVSGEGRMRGRVWGSPSGADDDAAPRAREDSSDEFDAPASAARLHEWLPVHGYDPGADLWSVPPDPALVPLSLDPKEMALWDVPPDTPSLLPPANEVPLWNVPDPATLAPLTLDPKEVALWSVPSEPAPLAPLTRDTEDVALKLRSLLLQAGIPSIDENLLLKGLLANGAQTKLPPEPIPPITKPSLDMIQSENDFIDAYNALTRASPLPNINKPNEPETETIYVSEAREQNIKDDEMHLSNVKDTNKITNKTSHPHNKQKDPPPKQNIKENIQDTNHTEITLEVNQEIKTKVTVPDQINSSSQDSNNFPPKSPSPILILNQITNKDTVTDKSNILTARPADEKSTNLNEIVDNTQKLIQQMKEEINSDIHSLDDGHSQTSQSDLDTSSHDEQESSYSESEEETNHTSITSDEKEITSSSSEDELIEANNEITRNNPEYVNRTSSEDNEQFEEALDNLDNQIEDVKHANIEILDSIARSLQEEHTISVEVNESKEINLELKDSNNKPIMIVNPQNENNIKNDDTQNISMIVEAPKENNNQKGDRNNNLFVPVNSFDEIYEELDTSNVHEKPASQSNNDQITSEINTNNIQNEVIENIPVIEPKILFTKYSMNESVFKVVSPTKIIILDAREPIYNAVMEQHVEVLENSSVENVTEVLDQNTDIDNTNQIENIVDIQENAETVNNSNNTAATAKNYTPEIIGTDSNNMDVTVANRPGEQDNAEVHKQPQNSITIPLNKVEPKQNGIIKKQSSPDKTLQSQTKSSIPKPVRTAPNNKPKNEKVTPKLLVSKVPVRRGSIKQHHAPAPPKAHFGNVQSGHVKQLQSKLQLFNAKPVKPQMTEIVVKPSTSTASLKKNPAPQPPKIEQKQSPPKSSPPREKSNNYFRETCRTEDEWTESDSDESQIIRQASVEEVMPAEPAPAPPITLRSISGNIIDLAKVRLPEGSPERQARMLLAEGAMESWEQAQLAVELVSRGAELPAALLAALECADLPSALAYLHQDCELCASRYPEHEMVSMLRCTHRCCGECARLYFTVQITERSIADCVCPFCKMPELEHLPEDAWLEYFSHLDIQLKTLLETDVHELFQRKLRDRTLAMDPNFRWCMECSSGFFVHPKQKKLRCPECRSVSCASCRKSWRSNHEGLSCEQYAAWLADNDPEISVAAVQQHLRENGLECPRCHFKYSLSRGGCMHFTCTQCKFEFCYGCGKPFTMGARCGLSEYCAKLGLHAHHPRNCLFYLRDKEPHELQTLLQMNNVTYETEAAEGSNGRCPIPLQRETPTGLVDGICGSEAPPKFAGLCKNHYLEYLTRLVRAAGADPLPVLGIDDLETLVRRAGQRLPPRPYGSLDGLYRRRLTEIVKEKIPLD